MERINFKDRVLIKDNMNTINAVNLLKKKTDKKKLKKVIKEGTLKFDKLMTIYI